MRELSNLFDSRGCEGLACATAVLAMIATEQALSPSPAGSRPGSAGIRAGTGHHLSRNSQVVLTMFVYRRSQATPFLSRSRGWLASYRSVLTLKSVTG